MTQASLPLEHDLYPLLAEEIPLEVPTRDFEVSADVAERMTIIQNDLLSKTGGLAKFAKETGKIIRDAIDYVIDAPTLYRLSVDDLEPDEKTAIGKRIERMLRYNFDIPRGAKLDILLAGEEVDIKTTMSDKWMFSKSSWNHVNLLIAYNERKSQYSAGLAFVVEELLGAENRDSKRTIKKAYYENISWIVLDEAYPPNFLAALPEPILAQIIPLQSANERVEALLTLVQGRVIPRHAICSVANQHDPLKRLRRNGGAREALWRKGILVLSGTSRSDRTIAKSVLGVDLESGEFASLSKNVSSLSEAMLTNYITEHGHRNAS
jgi:hypothetical protein